MNELLLILYPLGHLLLAFLELALGIFAIYLWRKSNSVAMFILPLVLASTTYDNLVLGTGKWIGEGVLLATLSQVRFLLHYLVVPLFIVVGIELAYRAGAKWTVTLVRVFSWIIALLIASIDIVKNFIGLQLAPIEFLGVLRYAPTTSTFPVSTIVINVFVLLVGIGLWVRIKWSGLFWGTLIALIGNAIPSSIVGTLPGSASEFVMALTLVLAEQRTQIVVPQMGSEDLPEEPLEGEFAWEYVIDKDRYTIYQTGSHREGNFIQVYVPKNPYRDTKGKTRVITYLHGFALCMPEFYATHLGELAGEKGYYVFFPDFQVSSYPDDPTVNTTTSETAEKPHIMWLQVLQDALSNRQKVHDLLKKARSKPVRSLLKRIKPGFFKYIRVSLAILLLIAIVTVVFSVFRRRYGQNLIKLISTVGLSLLYPPTQWIKEAIEITDKAWEELCEDNPVLKQEQFDFYVFGHSLGGLLALSWTAFVADALPDPIKQKKFTPQQVLTADPAPSTEMGIPQIALWVLKLFNSPFAEDPINIKETGPKLLLPVGIMHGADDTIVKPQAWVNPPLFSKQSNFDSIASQQKKIYFSLSNKSKDLIAFHNQAVTNTTYYSDALFKYFGGVKEGPNAYNFQYVWPGLDFVVRNEATADQLLPKFPLETIQVTETLPSRPHIFFWVLLLGILVFVLWRFAIV